jgi:hypothetical protein
VYDHVQHWGKLVHGVDAMCAALLFALLLLGWRDHESVALSDQLAAALAVCAGIFFGVVWEIVEFVLDWVLDTDLQKSNSDTMTDLLWNDLGVAIGVALAMWMYCRWATARDRASLGGVAEWLVDGPSRLLDQHGILMTLVVTALGAAAVTALWFTGRPVPGFPIG